MSERVGGDEGDGDDQCSLFIFFLTRMRTVGSPSAAAGLALGAADGGM